MVKFNNQWYQSSSEIFFEIFDDKLKLMIVWYLKNGTLRFTQLSQALSPITKKTLSLKLKALETLELIERKVYAQVPPKVEYSLSEKGALLVPVLDEILRWSHYYAKDFPKKISDDENES